LRTILSTFLFILAFTVAVRGQTDSARVLVRGLAYDAADPARRLEDLMIINLRTGQGTFGLADGSFQSVVERSDTFIVASTGYEFRKVCLADSAARPEYYLRVPLTKLNVHLKEVAIFSPRQLDAIYRDIEKLGYKKRDFRIGGADALQSPITFLYQEFSRLERLKRHNAERINNERRRELLRELLANYAAADIIHLDDSEFDDFIDFANIPEDYMKTATQYEFCIHVKRKFELYRMTKGRKF
jgi:hypothetical protein